MGSHVAGDRTFAIQSNIGQGDRGLCSSVNNVATCNYPADTVVPSSGMGVWQFHQPSALVGTANIDGTEYATTSYYNYDTTGAAVYFRPVFNGGPATTQIAFVCFFTRDTRTLSANLRTLYQDPIRKSVSLA